MKILRSLLLMFIIYFYLPARAQNIKAMQNMQIAQVNDSLIFTYEIPGGHTWTVTSRLGHMLAKAIEQFGPKDNSYTILGVEFRGDSDTPQVWYPGNRKYIAIQLGKSASLSVERASYQLAHEVIHCLSPTGGQNANVLEEGLATYFSEEYMLSEFNQPWKTTFPKYEAALQLVHSLLKIDKDIIKRVRQQEPVISNISAKQLINVNQNVPIELAEALCKKF